jgi:hypothetical protein
MFLQSLTNILGIYYNSHVQTQEGSLSYNNIDNDSRNVLLFKRGNALLRGNWYCSKIISLLDGYLHQTNMHYSIRILSARQKYEYFIDNILLNDHEFIFHCREFDW